MLRRVWIAIPLHFLVAQGNANAQTNLTALRHGAILSVAEDTSNVMAGIVLEGTTRLARAKTSVARDAIVRQVADTVKIYSDLRQTGTGRAIAKHPLGISLGLEKYLSREAPDLGVVSATFASYTFPYPISNLSDRISVRATTALRRGVGALRAADQRKLLMAIQPDAAGVSKLAPTSQSGKLLLDTILKASYGGAFDASEVRDLSQSFSASVLKDALGAPGKIADPNAALVARFAALLCSDIAGSSGGATATSIINVANQLGALAEVRDYLTLASTGQTPLTTLGIAVAFAGQVGFLNPEAGGSESSKQLADALRELTTVIREEFKKLNVRLDRIDNILSLIYSDLQNLKYLQEQTLASVNALLLLSNGLMQRLDQLETNVVAAIKEAGLVECESHLLPNAPRPSSQELNRCLVRVATVSASLSKAKAEFDFEHFRSLDAAKQESSADQLVIGFGKDCPIDIVMIDRYRRSNCSQRMQILAALITKDPLIESTAAYIESDRSIKVKLYAARLLLDLDRRWGNSQFRQNIRARKADLVDIAGSLDSGAAARRARGDFNRRSTSNLAEYFMAAASNATKALESAGDVGAIQSAKLESAECRVLARSASLSQVGDCWKRTMPNVLPGAKLGDALLKTKINQEVVLPEDGINISCAIVNKDNIAYNNPQYPSCPFGSLLTSIPLKKLDSSFAHLIGALRAISPNYGAISASANQVWPSQIGVIRHIVTLRFDRSAFGSDVFINSKEIETPIDAGSGASPTNVAAAHESIETAVGEMSKAFASEAWAAGRYLWSPLVSKLTFDEVDSAVDSMSRVSYIDRAVGWSEAANLAILEAWPQALDGSVLRAGGRMGIGRRDLENYRSCVNRLYVDYAGQTSWQARFAKTDSSRVKSVCGNLRYWSRYDLLPNQETVRPPTDTFRMWFEGESDRIWKVLPALKKLPKDELAPEEESLVSKELLKLAS